MTLFAQITDFNNLYTAYKTASKGKHDRKEVLRHDLQAEKILWRLKLELEKGTYKHGQYRFFKVYDPKERDVAAAPFTDRIVRHALVRHIEPLFERGFIYDSYACRKNKGTHAAVLRLQHFLRSAHDKYGSFYVLHGDIRKFFASVDHDILVSLLARKIKDNCTLNLCKEIINSYHEPIMPWQVALDLNCPLAESSLSLSLSLSDARAPLELKVPTGPTVGIPIGNLTSQLFANIYLNQLDQFVKHTLREPFYIRYMDDFLIIHKDKARLKEIQWRLSQFVQNKLNLKLHPNKTSIYPFGDYERFVGYDAGLYVRRLSKPTVQRFLRRIKRIKAVGNTDKLQTSWQNFRAYSDFAHAKGLLDKIYPNFKSE